MTTYNDIRHDKKNNNCVKYSSSDSFWDNEVTCWTENQQDLPNDSFNSVDGDIKFKKRNKQRNLKLKFDRLTKKYERICDQYKILENENVRLKSEIDSYLKPQEQSKVEEPKTEDEEDKWWRDNEVHLEKAELQAYVNLLNERNCEIHNLKKQVKYMNFKNNLLEKKVTYRNGVFSMIEKCVDGDIKVVHPDYDYDDIDLDELKMLNDRGEDKYQSAAKKEMTLTEKCMEKAKIRRIEREQEKQEDKEYETNIKLDICDIKEKTVEEDEDEKKEDVNDSNIHSKTNDEKTNETIGYEVNEINSLTDNCVGNSYYTENDFCPASDPSFKSVFGPRDEHVFRNCCLKVLYDKIPSYGVWEQLEGFDLLYWDSFDEQQCYKIIDSMWRNYHSDYPDLNNKITRLLEDVPKYLSDNNATYNYILKELVSWLFMIQ